MASQPTLQPSDGHDFWNRLVVPEETRQFLNRLIAALRDSQVPENADFLRRHQRILLSGPPGAGKSMLVRAVVQESGASFMLVSKLDLVSPYIGQGGNKVRELFEQVRQKAPSILLIDEIEEVCPVRRDNHDSRTDEVLVEMLMQFDAFRNKSLFPVLFAETLWPQRVDEAFLARLDTRIELQLPDAESRRLILRKLLADKSVDFDIDRISEELVERTAGASGRDLERMVLGTMQAALERAIGAGAVENGILTRQDLLDHLPRSIA